jgi:signal peptidase I
MMLSGLVDGIHGGLAHAESDSSPSAFRAEHMSAPATRELLPAATALAGIGLLAAAARLMLLRVTVRGVSMEPTFREGRQVLVLRTPLSRPSVGDVIVLRHGEQLVIKRLAAVAGDRVPPQVRGAVGAGPEDRVPDGRIVVLGDNTALSLDSRAQGYLRRSAVMGVVLGATRPSQGTNPAADG